MFGIDRVFVSTNRQPEQDAIQVSALRFGEGGDVRAADAKTAVTNLLSLANAFSERRPHEQLRGVHTLRVVRASIPKAPVLSRRVVHAIVRNKSHFRCECVCVKLRLIVRSASCSPGGTSDDCARASAFKED